jgi:hypothetical protein
MLGYFFRGKNYALTLTKKRVGFLGAIFFQTRAGICPVVERSLNNN